MSKEISHFKESIKQERVLLIGLTLVGLILAIFYWQTDSLAIYDAAGHLAAVESMRNFWPLPSGWASRELLGWPQGVFYPPLFHWLASGLSFLTGTANAIKILVSITLIVLPTTIVLFVRTISEDKIWSRLTALTIFAVIIFSPDFLGSNIRGLFHIGLLPNFFAVPVLFLFFASLNQKKVVLSTILLSVLVLTHLVAATLGFGYLFATLVSKLVFNDREFSRKFLLILGLTATLSAFFWIPFVANYQYTSLATHGIITSYLLPNLAVAAFSLGLLIYSVRNRAEEVFTPALFSGVITILALIDGVLFRRFGTSFALEATSTYRFQIFAYIFFATGVILILIRLSWTQKFQRLLPQGSYLLLFLIILSLIVKNPAKIEVPKIQLADGRQISGRYLETFRRLDALPVPYKLQTLLKEENESAAWAFGVFPESSASAPFIQSLIRSLRPEAYPEGDGKSLEARVVSSQKIDDLLSLFAIDYLIYLDRNVERPDGYWQAGEESRAISIRKVAESSLFEVPKYPLTAVEKDWNRRIEEWWITSGDVESLPVQASQDTVKKMPAGKRVPVEILETNNAGTLYKLKIDSNEPVPILAKISYFPYWHAFDSSGKEIPIYRVAPNLMLVNASGEIVLEYKEPSWLKLLYFLSAVTLLVLVIRRFRAR